MKTRRDFPSPRTRRLDVRTGLAVVAGAAAVALAGCSAQTSAQAPAATASAANATLTPAQRQHIRVYTVAESGFHRTIEATGVVDFDGDQSTSVLAPFSGPVKRLLVSPGDHVSKGDALALVDSADFAAATSAYSKALATARTARRVADIDKDLLAHNGISARDEAQAQTDAANAEADRDAALQALVSLQVDAQAIKAIQDGKPAARVESTIRSPISGTVVEKLITPGQLLQAGTTPCFTVADLSRVWVIAQVFDASLSSIRVGDPAEIETGIESKTLPGKVTNIAGVVDPNTRAIGVRITVDNPDALLRKQMYVRARIHSRRQDTGLLVPVSAILRDDENLPFVYVVQPDGSFARRRVTPGYRDADRFDITAGLEAGDQVVVDGGIFVQFMQAQ